MANLNKFQKELDTPEKLHEFARHYNWDDGIEIPKWIINNSFCDRGTALMIYWCAGPRFLCQYSNREEVPDWEQDDYDFVLEIEQKYLGQFYQNQNILFNPRYDMSPGMLGYDWTQDYDDKPQNREIPAEMLEPSIPDIKWEALGKPIKPTQKINYQEVFKPIDDWINSLSTGKSKG